ncbi:transporter substrate-binding domain-containing protein [soil metagenome]
MFHTGRVAFLAGALLILAACTPGAGSTPAPTEAPMSEAPMSEAPSVEPTGSTAGAVCENLPADAAGDLLATICERGTIVMSTDPAYPPQSEVTPDGNYEGFDIDVGTEIAKRLGVEIAFETPSWDVLTAGSWQGRWDFSVGSMTITSDRQEVIDFTQPYYFTPAQLAVRADSGITDTASLAGKTICVGEATTYLFWLEGTLDFGTETPQTEPPDGALSTTLQTDRDCAEAWRAGREEFDGWLSSSPTVQDAIDDGLPVIAVGDPVFYEPLAVALDKGAPDHDALLAAIDQIVAEMHADGTLNAFSIDNFGADLTNRIDE